MLATAIASVVMSTASPDFLLDAKPFTARVTRSEREVALDNGLIRRVWRTEPNLATVALDREGVSLLRAVGPEATVTLDGK
ncbi:MAG: alpha-galactosidase, partial [Fimbriimonadaceae bacterium]|nr:alpha-galactosidase [Fimbriimonadaceae bacterium]